MATATKRKAYRKTDGPTAEEKLVAALVELMDKGVSPWRKEWITSATDPRHRNAITGNYYQGANPALLEMFLMAQGHELPVWLGFGQGKTKGWKVKKGSKAAYLLRPQLNKAEQKDAEGTVLKDSNGDPLVSSWVSYKTCAVFNIGCFEGKDAKAQAELEAFKDGIRGDGTKRADCDHVPAALEVLGSWSVETRWQGDRAFYNSGTDLITMPARNRWSDPAAMAATWAHEAVHSTGHCKRLDRKLGTGFGTKDYAREELVAELGAFLICNRLQISSNTENHVAYLDHWRGVLQEGPKVLFKVLSDATKASNLICGPEVVESA